MFLNNDIKERIGRESGKERNRVKKAEIANEKYNE